MDKSKIPGQQMPDLYGAKKMEFKKPIAETVEGFSTDKQNFQAQLQQLMKELDSMKRPDAPGSPSRKPE